MSTPPPPAGHNVTDGHCICGVLVPANEADAHYYHVSAAAFKVCPDDGAPVVIDFSQPGMEWRCPECGQFYRFFGSCVYVPTTHELAVRYVAALNAKKAS